MQYPVKLVFLRFSEGGSGKHYVCNSHYHRKDKCIQRIAHSARKSYRHCKKYRAYFLCRTRYRTESYKRKGSCYRNACAYRTAHHHDNYADYRRKCGKRDNKALCVFVFVHIHKSHRYSEYQCRAYADKKTAQCYISRTAENSLYYRIKHLPLPHFLLFSFLCPCFV